MDVTFLYFGPGDESLDPGSSVSREKSLDPPPLKTGTRLVLPAFEGIAMMGQALFSCLSYHVSEFL